VRVVDPRRSRSMNCQSRLLVGRAGDHLPTSRPCARRTFVEQVEGLTIRYGRHTALLRRLLETVGLLLAGRAGARLSERLSAPVSRMTLLRLVRALPDPVAGEVTAVGGTISRYAAATSTARSSSTSTPIDR
jgi:hypothetical protein